MAGLCTEVNRRLPKVTGRCACAACVSCDEVYDAMVAGLSGVELDGFSASLYNATSLNGLYAIPVRTVPSDCLKGITQKICSEQAHPGFFLGTAEGSDWYLTNMLFVTDPPCDEDFNICGPNASGEDAPVVATVDFRGQCIDGSHQYTVNVEIWYPLFRFLPPSSNFWYCSIRTGTKTAGTIAGLLGPITLTPSSLPDFISGSVTANVV